MISFCLLAAVLAGPKIMVQDLHGKAVDAFARAGKEGSVFVFIAHDCPISNHYAPELKRIQSAYEPKGFKFEVVYEEQAALSAVAEHAKEYGYSSALYDPKEKLAQKFNVTVTPQVVVLSKTNALVYSGRIDNTYADVGRQRRVATVSDLRNALDQLLKGQTVRPSKTEPFGCSITKL